jgi:hypothetical protein
MNFEEMLNIKEITLNYVKGLNTTEIQQKKVIKKKLKKRQK